MTTYKIVFPTQLKSSTLNVCIHGMESSKQEWFDKDDYTKGGNLTERLLKQGHAVIALDLYGHGDWEVGAGFDKKDVTDEQWPTFISESVNAIASTIEKHCQNDEFDSVNIFSYSVGTVIAVKVIDKLSLPIKHLIFAAPSPDREENDEYSLHNNLAAFERSNIYLYCGLEEDEPIVEDTRWLIKQIKNETKTVRWYPSGHSLPITWVEDVFKDITFD